jgi:hypothetical protein
MKQIKLSGKYGRDKFALVDDEDFERIGKNKYRLNEKGYVVRTKTKNKIRAKYWLHREILGKKDGFVIDHINGDKLDNRKQNLRHCTSAQNSINRNIYAKNKTGYRGVRKRRSKYVATIGYAGKYLYIGAFDTPIEAAKRYNHFALNLHGEFARLNNV